MRRKVEIVVLVVYTLLTIRILWPFISSDGLLIGSAIDGRSNLLALFVGPFLNASLIIYWLNKNLYGAHREIAK